MAYIKTLTLVALFFVPSAHAFYATPTSPPGWGAPSPSATSAILRTGSGAQYLNGVSKVSATLNAAGRAVPIPATVRVAATAGRVLAGVAFANPLLFVGVLGASAIAYHYYNSHDLYVKNDVWVKRVDDGDTFWRDPWTGQFNHSSADDACKAGSPSYYAGADINDGYGSVTCLRSGDIYVAQTRPLAQVISRFVPVTAEEFSSIMAPFPVPDSVPESFPVPVDLPVDPPVINPDAQGVPKPYFVPTGSPIKQPGSTLCTQPGLTVKGTNNSLNQWEMDVLPVTLPDQTCAPKTAEQINAPLSPASSPASAPADAALPSDKQPGLCDQYPDIAACAPPVKDFCKDNPTAVSCLKVDDIEDIDLPTKDAEMNFAPDTGWGSGGGSCPADKVLTHATLSFRPYCDFLSGIRPAIIAVAWFIGALILIRASK